MSRTLAFIAAMVNRPDEPVLDDRSPGLLGSLADRHDVGIGAVAQEAGHGGSGQHHRVAGIAEFGGRTSDRNRATPSRLDSSATAVPPATVQRRAPSRMKLLSSHRSR